MQFQRNMLALAFFFSANGATLLAQQPASLQQTLNAIVARHHGNVALFAENLRTGQIVGIHPDQPVQTASVIKLAVLYEAMEQIRSGKVRLEDSIVLRKQDQVPGSGVLLFFDTPVTLTFKDLLTMMIVMSDNTATNLVIDRLGIENIDRRIHLLGLKDTYLYKKIFQPAEGPVPADQKTYGLGKTTPREMAGVMRKIVTCDLAMPGTLPQSGDPQLCAVAMHMLRSQFYRGGVPRYLEKIYPDADSAIANKTGALDAVRNDVAAIDTKRGTLVLSIFTYDNRDQTWSVDDEGEVTIAKLAKAIVKEWSPEGLSTFDAPMAQKQ